MLSAREYPHKQHNRPTQRKLNILGFTTSKKQIITIIAGIITAYILMLGLCGAIIFFAG